MTDWRMTSPESVDYNCIAWAAGEDDRFWWPDLLGIGYWPPGAVRRETLDAFVEAYGTLGYAVCADGILEEGFEKVALFTRAGKPTHAARQLRSGAWTSKLGRSFDIEHDTPEAVAGVPGCGIYGEVAVFLRRRL
jgi:hypothetical protein